MLQKHKSEWRDGNYIYYIMNLFYQYYSLGYLRIVVLYIL